MDILTFTRWIAIIGLGIGLVGILLRLKEIMNRPFKEDLSRPRGSLRRGILYAFTLGMAPWEKESTRQHWVAYLRGIFFHLGIFAAFGVLFASPWLAASGPVAASAGWLVWGFARSAALLIATLTGLGAILGYAGIVIRLRGENERALSLPDDYASVALTSTFTALACLTLLAAALPALQPAFALLAALFYLVTAVMAVYIPFSKIRHCVYFFYSKFFFGFNFGRRGVIGQSKGEFSPNKYAE
jgi:hypothetical protein